MIDAKLDAVQCEKEQLERRLEVLKAEGAKAKAGALCADHKARSPGAVPAHVNVAG